MGRFFCDYCDTYLTHDSAKGRQQHNYGWKHRENYRMYYAKFVSNPVLAQQALMPQQRPMSSHSGANKQRPPPSMAPSLLGSARPPRGMMPPPHMRPPMMFARGPPGPMGMMYPPRGAPPGVAPGGGAGGGAGAGAPRT